MTLAEVYRMTPADADLLVRQVLWWEPQEDKDDDDEPDGPVEV